MTMPSFFEDRRAITPLQLDWLRRIAGHAADLGMPAYLVGGPVRDLLLGRQVRDFDLVLEGNAVHLGRRLVRAFGGTVTVHKKFHTARWSVRDSGAGMESLDLITARSETYPRPGALPDVTPATIHADLQRRDFTINALAVRLDGGNFGELLDPLDGQADLEHGSIRVLHPRSFLDDPTRMLRAVRYAERYGFRIVPDTRMLINDEARSVLSGLSGERLRHEFDLIFEEVHPSGVVELLGSFDLLKPVHTSLSEIPFRIKEIEAPPRGWGDFDVPEILSLRQMIGWVCWLSPLTADDIASIAKRLAFPAALTRACQAASTLLKGLPDYADAQPSRWTFWLDGLPAAAVYAGYQLTREPALNEYLSIWRRVQHKTTGDDLKARGLKPGPRFQEILSRLRAARLDGEVDSDDGEARLLEALIRAERT